MSKEARTGAGTWEREASTLALRVSDSLRELLGGAPTSLEGLLSFVHPEDRDNVERGLASRDECFVPIDHRVVCADTGDVLAVDHSWAHARDASGHVLRTVGMVRTRPATASAGGRGGVEGLEASEGKRMLLTLIANLPGFVYRCANDRDWTMYYLGGRFEEVTGYDPEAVLQNRELPFNDMIVEEHREYLWKTWQERLEKREPLMAEYTIRTKDGRIKWVWEQGRGVFDEKGQLLGLEGFITDITTRKQAEQALEERTAKLRLALQAARMGTWEWDIVRNRVHWSPETMEIFGLEPGAFGGTYEAYLQYVSPDSLDRIRTQVEQYLAGSEDTALQYDHEIVRGDGKPGWIELRGEVFRDEDGRAIGMMGVCVDVWARRQVELERQSLEAQLVKSQKLEAVGRLAGGVAHDFNNLLTAIVGHVEFARLAIEEELEEGHEAFQAISEVERASWRAADLIKQLLAFSRQDVTQPKVFNLNETLRHVDGMLRRLISENIVFEAKTDPALLSVRADPARIEQVIVNLVVNAVHAMPEGGHLLVETKNTVLGEDYERTHPNASAGSRVMLVVSDTGHGMDSATQERVFEPFFTTKERGRGTGLGLASVHGIVTQSGGHIMVYSEPGRGTVFKVYLPAVEQAPRPTRRPQSPAQVVGGQETILVCEDEPSVRAMTASVLRRAGYQILVAVDGREGVDLADAHTGPIALLVTDVIMPKMDGKALTETLRAKQPTIKVLYVSGYTSNVIAHHGVLDDGVDFLEKPFSRAALLTKVREILDRDPSAS